MVGPFGKMTAKFSWRGERSSLEQLYLYTNQQLGGVPSDEPWHESGVQPVEPTREERCCDSLREVQLNQAKEVRLSERTKTMNTGIEFAVSVREAPQQEENLGRFYTPSPY